MSKQVLSALAVVGSALSLAAHADVEVAPNTTVGSQVFFDFSNISNQQNSNTPKYVDVAPTGTGFDIKRLYLIVDHKFDDVWSANLTTDAQYLSAPSSITSTTTTKNGVSTIASTTSTNNSGGVTEVFIKKLYLQAKLDDAFIVRAGSYNSPWAPFVESLYGYRWIDKTATDRLGFANTADWGVNAGGKFGDSGLSYSVSAVDGAGYKNPSRTKTVDVEGRIAYVPLEGLTIAVGGYAGHLGQVTVTNDAFDKNTATRLDFAIGYTIAGFRVGGEYYQAKNYKTVNTITAGVYGTSAVVASTATGVVPHDEADGGSVWASYSFTEQYSVFARADDTKLSKDVLPGLKDKYFNVGVAYKPIKSIDLALVYRNEKVEHGTNTVSGADANGSYTIGGTNATNDGKFSEVGIYAQWVF
jgi:hypothetical protein